MKSRKDRKAQREVKEKTQQVTAAYRNNARGRIDILGSYTGVPGDNADTQPVQDADDL